MRANAFISLLLAYSVVSKDVQQNCPLLGPDFPSPQKISQSPIIETAKTAFLDALDKDKYGSSLLNITTWSVAVFSANEEDLAFEHHNTASNLKNATVGTRSVDIDSVYRIGSLSKMFTVWTLLREVGEEVFYQPITKYIPELRAMSNESSGDSTVYDDINDIHWEDITILNLASQLAGLPRDVAGGFEQSDAVIEQYGFPKSYPLEDPGCGWYDMRKPCDRATFFDALSKAPPAFRSSTTPVYSNLAFQLLGYAVESITGQPFQALVEKTFDDAGMKDTSYEVPETTDNGVIPYGNITSAWWNITLGDEDPAGSYYSTTRDLVRAGRAILRSATLPSAVTRRWLKPAGALSDPYAMVGVPFEIRRITLDSGRIIDLYTKGGNVGVYSTLLVLVPDLDIGISVLAAFDPEHRVADGINAVQNGIISEFLDRIEQVARQQAASTFAGRYTASDGSNSSLTISVDERPGLNAEFVSRGKETLTLLRGASQADVRLYPTGLKAVARKQDGEGTFVQRLAFRTVADPVPTEVAPGKYSTSCLSWLLVGGDLFGGLPVDQFVFTFNEDGDVDFVENRALELKLQKVA